MSQPFFCQSDKLTRVSNDRNKRGFQDRIQKMVAPGQPLEKFLARHDDGIYLALQNLLSRRDLIGDLLKAKFSDDKEVDIALSAGLASSNGPVQECEGKPSAQRFKDFPKHISSAGRLSNEALQLIEDRASGVRLEQNLTVFCHTKNNTRFGQALQLSLARSRRNPGQTQDLPQVERFILMAEEQGQN